MGYPLFQSTLKSSTPFPGTMADTSTPTPADGAQEQAAAYVDPQQRVAADEQADEAARQERLRFLEQQKRAKLAEIEQVKNLQWVGNTKKYARLGPERYKRWQQTAMNGTREFEPPEMMYERMKLIERMSEGVVKLQEQIRFESQLSPYQEAYRRNSGENQANQEDIQANIARWRQANEVLKAQGLPEIPEDTLQSLAQNLTASTSGRYGTVDPVGQLTDAAKYAQETGPEGVNLLPEGPLRLAGAASAKYQDKNRKEDNAKKAAGDKPEYTTAQLFNMGQSLYNDILNATPKTGKEKYMEKNPIYGQPDVERERNIHSEDDAKAARVKVAIILPDILKKFPNYVKEGAAAAPAVEEEKAGDQGQKGVKPDIKALLKARKPKAQ